MRADLAFPPVRHLRHAPRATRHAPRATRHAPRATRNYESAIRFVKYLSPEFGSFLRFFSNFFSFSFFSFFQKIFLSVSYLFKFKKLKIFFLQKIFLRKSEKTKKISFKEVMI
jgi:hypothetical protein